MTERQMSVRLVAVGGKQVKAELLDVGAAGQRAMGQIEQSSARMGPAVQNAAFQMGDFFVQVQSGTPIMRAAAQQVPQLLGGFGMWGAVAGAAIPIGVILWQTIADVGEEAKTAEERIKDMTEAQRAYQSAAQASVTPIADLIAKYGDLAEEVREVQKAEAELARDRALRSVTSSMALATDSVGIRGMSPETLAGAEAAERAADELYARVQRIQDSLTQETARFFDFTEDLREIDRLRAEVDAVRFAISSMAEDMGITEAQAEAVAVAFAGVRDAASGSAQDQVDAAQALIDALVNAYGSLDAANEATGGLVTQLLAAQQAAADIAAVDMASGIADASAEALALAQNLGISLETAVRLAALGPQGINLNPDPSGQVYSGRGGDPRTQGGAFIDWQTREATSWLAAWKPARKGAGRGGMSDAAKAERDALREVERLYDQTRTKAEKFAEEQARINELFAEGYIDADLHARGIAMLEEKYLGITSSAEALQDVQDDLKEAILDFAQTGEGAFDQVAAAIERMALQAILFGEGPFGSIFKDAFGVEGGFAGLITDMLGLPSFEGGGYTGNAARTGGLDGKGGYLAMLHPREHVVDMERQQKIGLAASGVRAGGTVVQVNNYSSGAVEQERSKGPDGEEIIRVTVGRQLSQGDHDRALSARTGGKPRLVRR